MLLMAKLTMFLMILGLLQVSAESYSQTAKLRIKMNNVPIVEVFSEIERISQFRFFYDNDLVDLSQKVSIDAESELITDILDEIFLDTDLHYEVMDRFILVKSPDSKQMLSVRNRFMQQQRIVSGRVTDSGGQPLPGVSIIIKGTAQGTITDADGQYSVTNLPANATLVFSFIGMKTQEVVVGNQTSVNITMEEDVIGIEEVVAIGYGTKKKANLTGAVDMVSYDVLENRPMKNLGEGLQGLIPNLNITVPSGKPSVSPSFNIRGYTSINGGSPLIIVDGTPMDLDMINFEDVESISVLKDASSAAIYGARAPYGVVLVTTKSGKAGDLQINYSANFQLNRATEIPEFIESYPLVLETNAAWKMATGSPLYTDQQVEWVRQYYEDPENTPVYHIGDDGRIFWNGNHKPMERLLSDWYPGHKHTLSLSGGTDKMLYYASAGYQNNDGIFEINTDKFKQYNTLLKLENTIKGWFKTGIQLSYNKNNYNEPFPYLESGSGTYEYYPGRGNVPSYHLVKNWRNFPVGAPLFTTDDMPCGAGIPIGETDAEYFVGGRQISVGETSYIKLYNEMNLLKGLIIHTDFSYRNNSTFVKGEKIPVDFIMYDFNAFSQGWTQPGYVARQYDDRDYYSFNSYADYKIQFGNHQINGIIGFNQEWLKYASLWGQGNEIISSNLPVIRLTSGEQFTRDTDGHWAIRGSFFRFSYDYKQKYLLEINGRYDGTSKFPPESRYAVFPSFSAAWRISEEAFFNPLTSIINNAKLRASYGSLGNQNVANYFYIPSMSVTSQINYIMGNSTPLGVNNPGLVSADLTWEKTTTLNFGIDLALWNKLNVSYDWFQRNTTDMLTAGQALPALLGTSVPRENNAEMQTVGWEFILGYSGKSNYGLLYNIDFVLSDYQGTITKFDGNPNKLVTTYYEGQKLGEIWGYETAGLFQSLDEVKNSANQNQLGNAGRWRPGEVRYSDLNDDGVINWGDNTLENPGDRKIIGNSTPRYSFGVNSKFQYKGFDLALFFQGVGKKDVIPSSVSEEGKLFWGLIAQNFANVRKEYYENRWSEDNPDAYYPVSNRNSAWNRLPQTRYLQSGAYVRLKNITIGYTVPKMVVDKMHISKLYIYLSGQNLWELTSLPPGFDPESLRNQSEFTGQEYPFTRVYSIGINLNL